MGKQAARGWKEHNDAERWTRETEQAVHRVCEALTGVCVMVNDRDREPCNPVNCAAYRAAFTPSGSGGT